MKTQNKNNNTQVKKSKNEEIFTLVKGEDKKVRIAIGNYLVSQKTFDTFGQADQYISTKPYEIIINLAYIAIKTKEENETKKQNKED